MDTEKICLVLGAGAESSFGLSTGRDFAEIVLGIKDNIIVQEMNQAIKNYYLSLNVVEWYPEFRQSNWTEDQILYAIVQTEILNGTLEFDNKREYSENIKYEIRKIKGNSKSYTERLKKLNSPLSYMSLLDSAFHTLLEPKLLGPELFWRVISCYTRAYLLIVSEMLDDVSYRNNQEGYENILKNKKDVVEKVKKWARMQNTEKSYYSTISALNSSDNVRVITSNYTPLCSEITNIDDNYIAYVNGRIGIYESAYELRTYDVEEDDITDLIDDILFPYIFVQSGVKPIIEKRQLSEYSKVLGFLEECNYMGIMGYHINLDDNHINSLIRSFLLEKKKVVYFNFKNENTKESIERKLRITGMGFDLELIEIDDKNCNIRFENWLKKKF